MMSSGVPWVAAERNDTGLRWLADYLELTKPRIGAMVLITVAIAAFLATGGEPNPWVLASALAGTGLVAASASVWNHWWEQETDSRMQRTRGRCLPAGRLLPRDALLFGSALIVAGIAVLAVGTTVPAALFAMSSWLCYVVLYTPMKRRSTWNTFVGAISGALPVLIGWTAMGAGLNSRILALFGVVFLWQFPHFMAIAWCYRQDYAAAGMQMLTVVDPTGHRAGRQAVWGALALIPVSVLPAWSESIPLPVLAGLLAMGVWFLVAALRFCWGPSDVTARRLLRNSLIYLPAAMAVYGLLPWLTW